MDRIIREIRQAIDPELARLDPGEREAIQLAQQEHADLLLMDESAGVRLARLRGLTVTGTLGVLIQAARQDLLDIDLALQRLQLDFCCAPTG